MMIPLIVHQVFSYGFFTLAMLTNISFIAISTTTPCETIGRYRLLMTAFAIMDIVVALIHFILMPGLQMTNIGYIFYGYHLINAPSYVGTIGGILFVVCFAQTFVILSFHYVYRYALVCSPPWLYLFTNNRTFWWSLTAVSAQVLYSLGFYFVCECGFIPTDYKSHYYQSVMYNATGIDISKLDFGYLGIIYRMPDASGREEWQTDAIIAMVTAIALFAVTGVVIIICIALIVCKLSIAKSMMMSKVTRSMHGQLLKALLVQTAIPTVFTYIPLGTIFVAPFIGFDLAGIFGDLLIMSCAVFPALDPIIMIYFVRRYRERIVKILFVCALRRSSPVRQLDITYTRNDESRL